MAALQAAAEEQHCRAAERRSDKATKRQSDKAPATSDTRRRAQGNAVHAVSTRCSGMRRWQCARARLVSAHLGCPAANRRARCGRLLAMLLVWRSCGRAVARHARKGSEVGAHMSHECFTVVFKKQSAHATEISYVRVLRSHVLRSHPRPALTHPHPAGRSDRYREAHTQLYLY